MAGNGQERSTGWMPVSVAVLGTVMLVQVLLLSRLWCASGRLDDRVAGLEETVEELEESGELADVLLEVQEDLEALEDEVDAIRASTIYSSGKLGLLDSKVDRDVGDITTMLTDLFPQIEEIVDRKVEEKMTDTGQKGQVRYKSMDSLAKDLGLSQYQKQKTEDIFNQAKLEAFEVVSQPREDGTSVLDALIETIRNSDKPQRDGMRTLWKLMAENVPGSDETYFSKLKKIREEAVDEASEGMSPEQATKLDSMLVDVFYLDTGYHPLTTYMKDAMDKE